MVGVDGDEGGRSGDIVGGFCFYFGKRLRCDSRGGESELIFCMFWR